MTAARMTVGEALARFRAATSLSPHELRADSWTCRFGSVRVTFPNFQWRRAAIERHDLHHVLTGYVCTIRGEIETAAWEFGSGRFPHAGATAFCLPLIALGIIWTPARTWRAFLRGRFGRSAYGMTLSEVFLASPIDVMREAFAPPAETPRWRDKTAFGAIVVCAVVWVGTPMAIIVAAGWAMGAL